MILNIQKYSPEILKQKEEINGFFLLLKVTSLLLTMYKDPECFLYTDNQMKTLHALLLILILLIPLGSCRKVMDYFRDPDTGQLAEAIHTTVMAGYAANVAMAVIDGHSFPNVTVSRSNDGFPCTTLMVIDTDADPNLNFAAEKASQITVAGLWPDASTAILTLILTDYHIGASTLDLLGIQTIPVIRDADHINVALAGMDIQLNPDQEALLSLDLTTLEIESELLRLETTPPDDIYVAVLQNAYFIDVYNNSTANSISDDSYTVTGGGQLVEVSGAAAEVIQQAMVEVKVTPACVLNPVSGMALIKVTGLEADGFPELGAAVLEFTAGCGGTARVFLATGMYAGSNGKNITFHL
jgi:hypothetical protein